MMLPKKYKLWIQAALSVLFLLAGGLFKNAESTPQNGNLSQTRALYVEALRVLDPEVFTEALAEASAEALDGKLPNELKSTTGPIKCAFGLANRVRRQWYRFNTEEQAKLAAMVLRPDLPLSLTSPSGRFKIHYAISGSNGVPPEDLDASGLPDYVEHAAAILDSVYNVEVGLLNFKAPPLDDVDGPEWDVYIRNIPGSYGWTNPDRQLSSHPDVYTSYIELDNNYTGTPTKGLDGLRITAAHEFFHMIQLGYNARDDDGDDSFDDQFLMEASCTWMEDRVFDRINDYYYYLPEYFSENDIPFDRLDGWREYGLCLWFHFLVKRFETTEIVRSVWDEIISVPAFDANERALAKRGSSFAEELATYYAWNVMTGSRADTVQFYTEGRVYPEMALDGDGHFRLDTVLTSQAQPTASRYYRFGQDDGSSFFLVPVNSDWTSKSGDPRFTMALVNDDDHPYYTDLNNGVSVRMVANGFLNFRCTAVAMRPGGQTEMVPFRAEKSDQNERVLPACFPNPFIPKNHAGVTIPFWLPNPSVVDIRIFDAAGYRIWDEEKYFTSAGTQYVQWNGRNSRNETVSGGIYVYVVSTRSAQLRTEKIAVIR